MNTIYLAEQIRNNAVTIPNEIYVTDRWLSGMQIDYKGIGLLGENPHLLMLVLPDNQSVIINIIESDEMTINTLGGPCIKYFEIPYNIGSKYKRELDDLCKYYSSKHRSIFLKKIQKIIGDENLIFYRPNHTTDIVPEILLVYYIFKNHYRIIGLNPNLNVNMYNVIYNNCDFEFRYDADGIYRAYSKTSIGYLTLRYSIKDKQHLPIYEENNKLFDKTVKLFSEYEDCVCHESEVSTFKPQNLNDIYLRFDTPEIKPNDNILLSDIFKSPRNVKEYLDLYVYGQEQAKKSAAILLFNHIRGIRKNTLFVGPSGCGKTEIFRTLKQIYSNIYIYDASNITSDGWKGNKKSYSVFTDMLSSGYTKDQIEHSIIVFDEFDKICVPAFTSGGENAHYEVQGQMLSMVEGTEMCVTAKNNPCDIMIDTSNITFVFLGAFEGLYVTHKEESKGFGFGVETKSEEKIFTIEDVIKFGLRPELAGRISSLVQLDILTQEDFYKILDDNNISPIKYFSDLYKCDLSLDDITKKKIAKEAEGNKLGVRYLFSRIQNMIDESMYETGVPSLSCDSKCGEL